MPLSSLQRPRLLVRAARHGLSDYNRTRDLRRITGFATTAKPNRVTAQLLDMESNMEQRRVAGDHTYEPARHIELLVALMAETRHTAEQATAKCTHRIPSGWRVVDGKDGANPR